MEPRQLAGSEHAAICFKLQMYSGRIGTPFEPQEVRATVPNLIHRNAGLAAAGKSTGPPPAVGHRHQPVSERAGGEELMSAAEQAFLLIGGLFVLSFLAIGAFWFADKLRRNLTGKP
jgi:hypothetical protein